MNKLAGPGLLRFSLATVTLIHHFTRFSVGSTCVYLFFSLSGYWIYKMWYAHYSETRNPYMTYVISRAWRVLPVFIISAATCIACEVLIGNTSTEIKGSVGWARFLFSQLLILGYSRLPVKPDVPGWSLDMEVQFYLIAPLLVFVAARVRSSMLLATGGLISIISVVLLGRNWISDYLFFFIMGVVSAKTQWLPSKTVTALSSIVGFAIVLLCLISPYKTALLVGAHPGPFSHYSDFLNIALAVFWTPFAIYTTKQRGFSFDRILGDLSYIVYLIHWAAFVLVNHYWQVFGRWQTTALAVAAVYLISVLIWVIADRPMNEARSTWVASRKIKALPRPVRLPR